MGTAKTHGQIKSLQPGPSGIKCSCCGGWKWGKRAKRKVARSYRRIMRQKLTKNRAGDQL